MSTQQSAEGFRLFGPAHLIIIAAIPALAWILAWVARGNPSTAFRIRIFLGSFLALNELAWYGFEIGTGGLRMDVLPLQLCDITVWVTVIALFTLKPVSYEIAYFVGIAGSGMAILTPDLAWPLFSIPVMHFFLMHGIAIASILFMTWSGQARPRPGGMWRAFLFLNICAAVMGTINFIFKTNYMYLCQKPVSASIFDFFGPWPLYILSTEILAIVLFYLLWLPMRNRPMSGAPLKAGKFTPDLHT